MSGAERIYLAQLAHALGLDPPLTGVFGSGFRTTALPSARPPGGRWARGFREGPASGAARGERGADDDLVEPGRVGGAKAGRVGVVREAEDRDVGPRLGHLVGLHARDVDDHEVGRLDAAGRDDVMPREQGFELSPEEEVDSREQDRRH